MLWRGRQFEFVFPRSALIMGVVNVTPDSFSDGGQFLEPTAAIEHGLRLAAEGADILDIGGESTRPGAQSVTEQEELRRVMPVVEGLVSRAGVPISIDTTKHGVAQQALNAGAVIVNDIAGNRKDPAMWRLVAQAGAGYVLMHMKGTPQSMQSQAEYRDVVGEVNDFFRERLERLAVEGVQPEQVVLDPGIGFAKTADHNLQLLAALPSLTKWNRPIVLGASRKSFIGQISGGGDASARVPGSLACACWAVAAGVGIIRAHDVAETRQATRIIEAIAQRKRND